MIGKQIETDWLSDGDYKTEKINAKMRKLEDKMNPSKKRALITMPDGAVMEEG